MKHSGRGFESGATLPRRRIGRKGVKHAIKISSVSALTSLLVVLTTPAIQASAITSSGGPGQAAVQSRGGESSTSASGGNPATVGLANAVITGVGAGSIPISVLVGNPIRLPTVSGAEYSVTTVVGMGQRALTVSPMTQFSGPACGYDGSYAVYQCTTMYYNIKSDSSNVYFADNHQDSIAATNYDPTDVVLSSLTLATGGNGRACNGSGSLNGGATWNISSPTSGTTYNETPSWSGNYYSLTDIVAGTNQSVTGTLHWSYRGTPETLAMTYSLPDSMSSWPTGGCSN